MISRRLGEADLTIPVLYVLSTRGSMQTSNLKENILRILNPIGENLIPLENRNDSVIHQIIRNIISHRGSLSNIIGKGLVDYDENNGLLSITSLGKDYIERNIANGIKNSSL